MSGAHPNRTITNLCLLAATAVPIMYWGTQIVAAPYYTNYSFSNHSVSMLGTQLSRHPWIFNVGIMLTGFVALAAAFGLYRVFREKTNLLISALIGLAVACVGILTMKAGMFPMPDPYHNSWGLLQKFTIITPHLMLIGLWRQRDSRDLRIYLVVSILFLLFLDPLSAGFGRGTLQRLITLGTLTPVGVIGFAFWRELHLRPQD